MRPCLVELMMELPGVKIDLWAEPSRGTSDEGLHHCAHGTCATVGLEAASGATVLVDGHVGDLHLEHGDVVLEADCLGALAISNACLFGGLALGAWWGALGRWQRGQDTSPGQTSIGSLCWLGLGARHKVVSHVWAVIG